MFFTKIYPGFLFLPAVILQFVIFVLFIIKIEIFPIILRVSLGILLYRQMENTMRKNERRRFMMRSSSLITGLTAGLAAGAVASMMAAGAMMNPTVRKKVNHTARHAEGQMHQLAGKAEQQMHDVMNRFH